MKIGWGERALYPKYFHFGASEKVKAKKRTIARYFFIYFTAVNKKCGILYFTNSDNEIKWEKKCVAIDQIASFSMQFFQSTSINTKCILLACFITSFPFTVQSGAGWWIFQFYFVLPDGYKQRKDNNYLARMHKSKTFNIGCVLSVDPMNVKWMERKTAVLNFIWSFSSFLLPKMLSITRYGVRNQQNVYAKHGSMKIKCREYIMYASVRKAVQNSYAK